MGRPIKSRSLDEAQVVGPGEPVLTGGHNSLALYVIVRGIDVSADTAEVRVESNIADTWSTITRPDGSTALSITTDQLEDVNGDGVYTACVYGHGIPAERVRANVTSLDGNGNIEAYIVAANWNGPAREFREIL